MADVQTIGERIGLPSHMKIMAVGPDGVSKGTSDDENPSFTVLVNPESYQVKHVTHFVKDQAFNSAAATYRFNKADPESFAIDLLFDNTGSLGNVPFINQKSVLDQINLFLELGFPEKGPSCKDCDDVKPKELLIVWGEMTFKGFLEKVDITYSHFDHTGSPIRAVAKCAFTGGKIKIGVDRTDEDQPVKKVDYAKEKHAINGVLKYGSYIAILSTQPRSALPKTLRQVEEVLKLII
ncbi:MAG: hypothetical protein WBA74_07750 [Cyclobacteriaceae bacterium]